MSKDVFTITTLLLSPATFPLPNVIFVQFKPLPQRRNSYIELYYLITFQDSKVKNNIPPTIRTIYTVYVPLLGSSGCTVWARLRGKAYWPA